MISKTLFTRTAFTVCVISWVGHAAAEESITPPRQILLQKSVELPVSKLELSLIRVIFPKAYKTPLYTHESPGPRYVVRGKLKIQESGQTHEYGPGQVYWETGQWMTAENISDGETEILIVELPKAK